MSRLFICGITCGPEIEKIKDLVERTKDHVDGFIWTVDYDSENDQSPHQTNLLIDFLRANKKDGKIIYHPWQNAHDWQANEWLHCGVLQEGDWVLMVDSSELPTEIFISNIKKIYIPQLQSQNAQALYASGRPYLFKFNDYLYFHGTPHWGLYGGSGQVVVIDDKEKKELITNKRDLNPAKHYQEHDTKYYLYGRSNIIDAFYGKYGGEKVKFHEFLRRQFRDYLKKNFGEANLKTLDLLFSQRPSSWKDDDYVTDMIEMEFCLSEYYRRTVLKQDFMKDIVPNREKWSFKNFLLTGDGFSDKNYLGTRLKYDKQ
jgi:hypothetical protein